MKNKRPVVIAGTTAVLAAGLVGATSAPAVAATRITSSSQLKASISQAVARESVSGSTISCCPQGYVNPDSTYVPAM
jgi:hypothetical protein